MDFLTLQCITALGAGLIVLFGCSVRRSLLFATTALALFVLANLWLFRLMRSTQRSAFAHD
jgi:hypothetical protein